MSDSLVVYILVGGTVFIGLVLGLFMAIGRRRSSNQQANSSEPPPLESTRVIFNGPPPLESMATQMILARPLCNSSGCKLCRDAANNPNLPNNYLLFDPNKGVINLGTVRKHRTKAVTKIQKTFRTHSRRHKAKTATTK